MIKHVCISKQTQRSNNHHTKHIKWRSKRAHYFEKKTNFINRTLHSAKCKYKYPSSIQRMEVIRFSHLELRWRKMLKQKKVRTTIHKMSSRFASPLWNKQKAHSSSNLTTWEFSPSFPKYELSRQQKEKKAKFPSYFLYQTANPLFKLSASPKQRHQKKMDFTSLFSFCCPGSQPLLHFSSLLL